MNKKEKAEALIKKEAETLIKELRAYKEKNNLSYDKLGKILDVHAHTVFAWFCGHQQPGEMAKKLIRDFLEKES